MLCFRNVAKLFVAALFVFISAVSRADMAVCVSSGISENICHGAYVDHDPVYLNKLGNIYISGDKVARQYGEARRLYEQASEMGNMDAKNSLGVMYNTGVGGIVTDPQKAFELFKIAAEGGSAAAQYNLATLYFEGRGIAVNYEEATKWFKKADKSGVAGAKEGLRDVEAAVKSNKEATERHSEGLFKLNDPYQKKEITGTLLSRGEEENDDIEENEEEPYFITSVKGFFKYIDEKLPSWTYLVLLILVMVVILTSSILELVKKKCAIMLEKEKVEQLAAGRVRLLKGNAVRRYNTMYHQAGLKKIVTSKKTAAPDLQPSSAEFNPAKKTFKKFIRKLDPQPVLYEKKKSVKDKNIEEFNAESAIEKVVLAGTEVKLEPPIQYAADEVPANRKPKKFGEDGRAFNWESSVEGLNLATRTRIIGSVRTIAGKIWPDNDRILDLVSKAAVRHFKDDNDYVVILTEIGEIITGFRKSKPGTENLLEEQLIVLGIELVLDEALSVAKNQQGIEFNGSYVSLIGAICHDIWGLKDDELTIIGKKAVRAIAVYETKIQTHNGCSGLMPEARKDVIKAAGPDLEEESLARVLRVFTRDLPADCSPVEAEIIAEALAYSAESV